MFPDGWTVVPVEGVSIDIAAPPFHAECSWPTKQRGGIATIISLQDTAVAGGGLLAPATRINLLSASAREGLVRGAGLEGERRAALAAFLKELSGLVVELYRQQQPVQVLTGGAEPVPQQWMLYPIWPDSLRPTALIAAYGSLKTYALLACALSVASGEEILRGNTRPQRSAPVLFLDFESDQTEIERRLTALQNGYGSELGADRVKYLELSLPLVDVAQDVVTAVGNHGCGAVVIDSMSSAIGGSLVDDDSVNGFWNAVRALGVPTLVSAHKSVESMSKRRARFFGSSMSENRVQMAWNVEREPDTDRVVWDCFKDNAGRHLGDKLAWEWGFTNRGDDEDTLLESVVAEAVNPANVNLRQPREGGTIADGISEILDSEGPMMPGEIGELLAKPKATIRTVLHRHSDRFAKLPDGRWQLVTATVTDRPDPL